MIDKSSLLNKFRFLLAITALVIILIFVQISMSGQLRDPDIWLHLKTGEYIIQTHSVPQIDVFSNPIYAKPWIDHSWLVQIIFYLVFNTAGADGIILLSASVIVLAFLFLFFTFYKKGQDLTFIIAMLFLAASAPHMRFNIRPENFSILFFSIFLFILTRFKESKLIFILPFIQILWVNCHGFFVLGPMLLGIFIIGETFKRSKILPWDWADTGRFSNKAFQNLIIIFTLTCLASLVNPYGLKGALYPLGIMTGSASDLSIFYKHIQELLPTWVAHSTLNMNINMYSLLILVSTLSFFASFRKINLSHLIIWTILLILSAKINRNIMYFCFVAFIVTTDNLTRKFDYNKLDLKKPFSKLVCLSNFIIILAIIFWSLQNINTKLDKKYYVFDQYRSKSFLFGIVQNEYPEKASEFILKNNLPKNIFNLFNYGHYLIYKLYPKYRVFIDGRTELYGKEFFEDYLKIRDADDKTIQRAFKKYDINTVILHKDGLKELAIYFYKSPEWKLVYFSPDTLIFLKNTPPNKELIKKLGINLNKWIAPAAELNKIGLKNAYPEPYIKRAWLLYYFGYHKQAKQEIKEALKIMPNSAGPYCILAKIYLKENKLDLAYRNIRIAHIFTPRDNEVLNTLGEYFTAKKDYKQAINVYKTLVSIDPSLSESNCSLGLAYFKNNQYKDAAKYFKTAIKINPNSIRGYKGLGQTLYAEGKFKEAGDVYKKALKIGLDYRYFYIKLSKIYWSKLKNKP